MREDYETWFRGLYKQEPMPELGAPAHDFCWSGYIAGATSRDAEIESLRQQLAVANHAHEFMSQQYDDCVRQLTEAHARIDRFESAPKGW